jgi:hypothetical protein
LRRCLHQGQGFRLAYFTPASIALSCFKASESDRPSVDLPARVTQAMGTMSATVDRAGTGGEMTRPNAFQESGRITDD